MTAVALFVCGGFVGAALMVLEAASRREAKIDRLEAALADAETRVAHERARRQADLRREALSYLPADILTTHQERRALVLATEGRAFRAPLN